MGRLLITGFDPFAGATVNPSWAVVQALPERIGDYTLHKMRLPTIFSEAAEMVIREAERIGAEVILCLGVAGGRDAVTPERVGINIRSARVPDNRGYQPVEESIVPGGPDGLFSPLPVLAMAQAIRDAKCPGAVSNSAGSYVCNDVLYALLHHFRGSSVRCGFIHVPWLEGQGSPALTLETMVRGVSAAISAI